MYLNIVVMSFVQSAIGQVLKKGQCSENPDNIVIDLDVSAFMGTWYQIASIPNTHETDNCAAKTFRLVEQTPQTILVVDRELNERERRVTERYGNVTFRGGKFHSTFDDIKPDYYWVAAVNYDHYTMLYSCENLDSATKHVWAWMLGRARKMSSVAEDGFFNTVGSTPDLKGAAWTWTEQGEFCDGYEMVE